MVRLQRGLRGACARLDAKVYPGRRIEGHFKCNLRRLVDYPNLWGYARDLFQLYGIAKPVNFDHIRRHYYGSHKTINEGPQ